LRKLEAMGARAPWQEDGRALALGFRDSVNVETGAVCAHYIPALDQAMMFLALANVLEDRVVQRAFMGHGTVRAGCARLAEYRTAVDEAWLAELRRRDREPLPKVAHAAEGGATRVVVDDFAGADVATNRLGARNRAWTRDAADDTVTVTLRREERTGHGGCLRIDYDVESENPAYGGIELGLADTSIAGCDTLVLSMRGGPARLKMEVHGRGGGGARYVEREKTDDWTRVEIPLIRFGGMITDWAEMDRLVLVFEDGASKPRVGTLWIDDVAFERRGRRE
jgi:hypothetical protein